MTCNICTLLPPPIWDCLNIPVFHLFDPWLYFLNGFDDGMKVKTGKKNIYNMSFLGRISFTLHDMGAKTMIINSSLLPDSWSSHLTRLITEFLLLIPGVSDNWVKLFRMKAAIKPARKTSRTNIITRIQFIQTIIS